MKFRLKYQYLIVFGLLMFNANTKAQNFKLFDFETWWAAGAKYKYSKFVDLGLKQNLRFDQGSAKLQQYFTEFDIGINPLKNLDISTEIRLGIKNEEIINSSIFRYRFNLSYLFDFGRLEFRPKVGYQNRTLYRWPYRDNDLNIDLRYKIEVMYKIKDFKLDPQLSFEMFRHVNAGRGPSWDRFRIKLSSEVDAGKNGEIDLFIAYENELEEDFPHELFLLGFAYTFKFKRKKKEE